MSDRSQIPRNVPSLIGAKIMAGILSLYAFGYAVVLLMFGGFFATDPWGIVFLLAMLALAITPFMALVHLWRLSEICPEKPPRPVLMAVIMAMPALFWGYAAFDAPDGRDNFWWTFSLLWVPGLLALGLCVIFVQLAFRARSED